MKAILGLLLGLTAVLSFGILWRDTLGWKSLDSPSSKWQWKLTWPVLASLSKMFLNLVGNEPKKLAIVSFVVAFGCVAYCLVVLGVFGVEEHPRLYHPFKTENFEYKLTGRWLILLAGLSLNIAALATSLMGNK